MTEKERIRKKILGIRKKIGKKTADANSIEILKKLFRMKEFCQAKKVMFYSSFGNEVNTEKMIKKSLELKKQVFLPKILRGKIIPVQIENLKDLVRGRFGIPEPRNMNYELRTMNSLDVIIVPVVAFDKNCNRIGFGKGYFDRFLKTQKAIKIGIAYNFQIVKKIPVSKKDVPTDLVITEKNIFKRRK
ncbi:MAG: 5-formyltetrahydrofolate cyclo-ligase [Elusimicrobia bacterium]|nr:5-formyltetrahydrofolate cyclo-ligase [Elusimicrobiota bacterium]